VEIVAAQEFRRKRPGAGLGHDHHDGKGRAVDGMIGPLPGTCSSPHSIGLKEARIARRGNQRRKRSAMTC
jgi:hypothetical protein